MYIGSYFKNIFVPIFILCVSGLAAQTTPEKLPVPATLEECVDYAVRNNISVARAIISESSSKLDYRDAWGAFLPTVSASGGYNHNQGFSFDSNTNQRTTSTQQSVSVSAGMNINLFNGFKDLNAYRRSQLSMAATRYQSKQLLNDITLNVVSAYLSILSAIEYEKVTQNQCELSRMQVERMKRMIAVGKNAQGDLYEVEATLARDEQARVDASNQKALSYIALRQLLAMDMDTPLEVVAEGYEKLARPTVLDSNPMEIYMSAVEGLPEINKARKNIEIAHKNIAIAKGQFSPSLNAGYGWSNSFILDYHNPVTGEPITVKDQWKNNSHQYFQVSLSIPIFNRLSTVNNLRRSRLNLQEAQYALTEAQQSLQQKISQAYADASSSLQSFRAAEKAAKASQEALRYATAKFEQSKLSAYEYETAKNQLMRSQTDVLRTKYDYIFKTFLLDYYRSQNIRF